MGIKWTIAQQEKKNKLSVSAFQKTGVSSKGKRGSKRGSVLHSIGLLARKSKIAIELEDVVKAVP